MAHRILRGSRRGESQVVQPSKDAIDAAPTICKTATRHRNELIHGVHTYFESSTLHPIVSGYVQRSRRHKPELAKEWTSATLRA